MESATFELPQSPTPDSFNLGGSFTFDYEPAVVDGTPTNLLNLAFFNSAGLGGFMDSAFYNLTGAQLYSGAEGSPTFLPGVYQLTSFSGNMDTLTLSVAGVPEPSTWALMLIGFSGLGWAALRRGRKPSPALVG
jgi:PEP-CTERM motif